MGRARQSPSGPTILPFAQLGLSANVPFVDGDPLPVPFDTVVYETESFGAFESLNGVSVFFVPFGVYLATLELAVDTTPTSLAAALEVLSNATGDASGGTSAISSINLTTSAVRLTSEVPIPGHSLPCSVIPVVTVTGGGNGNVISTNTKLFVWQLQQF